LYCSTFPPRKQLFHRPKGERAKSFLPLAPSTFCPRAEAKPRRPRVSADPSKKIAFTFFDFARAIF
jgi:hypothetical protein